MRVAEARARFRAHAPRRGAALLLCAAPDSGPDREQLYPTLGAALRAAVALQADPHCGAVWVYHGRRLYDADAIAAVLAARDAPWPVGAADAAPFA